MISRIRRVLHLVSKRTHSNSTVSKGGTLEVMRSTTIKVLRYLVLDLYILCCSHSISVSRNLKKQCNTMIDIMCRNAPSQLGFAFTELIDQLHIEQ